MKIVLTLLAIIALRTVNPNETVIFYRIEALLQLRKVVLENQWPGSTSPEFDIPIIYYADSTCYVVNPTEKFLKQYKVELKYKKGKTTIYKTQGRIDSIPFHMETLVSDVETEYHYMSPWGRVSSLEETRKFAPSLSVREWSGMLLHELFHGYQFHHKDFREYAFKTKLVFSVINDTLQSYYNNYDWYKKGVDQENELLLQAIEAKDKESRKSLALKMLAVRDERRKMVAGQLNKPVEFYEPGFETMEGTARYIEGGIGTALQQTQFSKELLKLDTNYSKAALNKPDSNPQAGYKTEVSQKYTYATGYNMARLLDKFGSDYKKRLFKTPELTLEKCLREAVAK